MLFLELFYTFFIIGVFGFGGGYGMLSLIQTQTVNQHHWLSTAEFTNIVAISQMTPGPIVDIPLYIMLAWARRWLCWVRLLLPLLLCCHHSY